MLQDDFLDQRVIDAQSPDLQHQAIGQVEGADPRRVEGAHERQGFFDIRLVLVPRGLDLLACHAQVAVPVDVADEIRRDLANGRSGAGHRELPHQVLLKTRRARQRDRKSTRLNSSHVAISYAVFCLKKKKKKKKKKNKKKKKKKKRKRSKRKKTK